MATKKATEMVSAAAPVRNAKRAQILATAQDLFSAHGFHATGVDAIMATAGISKRTLYKYFPAKDDLIDEVVCQYQTMVKEVWTANTAHGTPHEKILAVFESALAGLGDRGSHGCLAVRAMAEFGGTGLPVESRSQDFKRWQRQSFETLANELGVADPKELGLRLSLMLDGMFSYAQVSRTSPPSEIIDWVNETLDQAS